MDLDNRPYYDLEAEPEYTENIEMLLDKDTVKAEGSFFQRLLLRIMNNIKAVKQSVDAVRESLNASINELLGRENGIATTDGNNKVIQTAKKADSVPWGGVTDKPSTFTPSTHSHTKSQISDFPATMAPAAHTHGVADITGALPINKGGTNATTSAAALTNLGAAAAGHSHSNATTSAAGFMNTTDKAKIDKCPADTNAALANKANIGGLGETNLTLKNGFTAYYRANYSKDPFNIVHISFTVFKDNIEMAEGHVVTALPGGYRPSRRIAVPSTIRLAGGAFEAVDFDIDTNGYVMYMGPTKPASERWLLICNTSYLATQ